MSRSTGSDRGGVDDGGGGHAGAFCHALEEGSEFDVNIRGGGGFSDCMSGSVKALDQAPKFAAWSGENSLWDGAVKGGDERGLEQHHDDDEHETCACNLVHDCLW